MAERRVAWVTGGGRGIGRASALALAHAGCDVAVSARSAPELEETAGACRAAGARALAAPCDVTDPVAVEATHALVAKELGAPAVLVSGAGAARSAPFHRTTPELMDALWRLNVLGAYHAMRVALPAMLEARWGRVINVASVAGKAGAPYISAYATSKHALLGLTRSVATEVASKGVTVNAVCPGYVDTQMTHDSLDFLVREKGLSREEALKAVLATTRQTRLVTPDEVASAVAYLASDGAAMVNGQAITIDGGGLQW